ncbi:unnamed protein product [Trichobilharzia regenti]|nr:unnamed protein product [Trichobilharzia regenti]
MLKIPYLYQKYSVSSVETRAKNNNGQHELIILHRGSNTWTYDSFNRHFIYRNEKWGKNMFILPHSITLSYFMDGNAVWITDVALHQVFKFDWMKWDKPSLTLGIPGRPGNNRGQFCQPADVVISSKGDIFVADGYCNSRIVKFSSNANMDLNRYDFKVVHSLTIIPSDEDGSLEQVCAADRENAAVLCYTLDGKLIRRYADSSIQPSVYAIQYDPELEDYVFSITRTSNYIRTFCLSH